MNADAHEVPCDSLSGAEFGVHAHSIPPSLRPRRSRAWVPRAAWGAAGVLLAVAVFARPRAAPADSSHSDGLRVEGRTLSYSEGFAARAGIRTTEVQEAAFSPVVSAAGKATFDPSEVAAVGANALGTVRRVLKYEGESVKRGDVLAEIGSVGWARIEAATLLRTRQAPSRELGISRVRSPLEGTVVERRIVTGESVKGERVVFVVANLDWLSLDFALDRPQARALTVGDRVELVSVSPPGEPILGRVAVVGDPGGAESATVLVRVGIDNRARGLHPGQAVTAKIFASGGVRALVIPNRALAWIAGSPAVFVYSGRNSVSAAAVTLGGCNGEQTAVTVGLVPGQRVVSDGVGTLKDESFL